MGHHDPKRRNRFAQGNKANRKAKRVGGVIQARDTLSRRTRDALGRIATELLPVPPDPETDAKLAEAASPKDALKIMRARDLSRGTFRRLWDRLVARAEGGDVTALREYFGKFFPRDVGVMAVGGSIEHRHTVDAETARILDCLVGRLGGVTDGASPVPPAAAADGGGGRLLPAKAAGVARGV